MTTCIAYLIAIRKFCSKNLVHKGVNFEAENALKPVASPEGGRGEASPLLVYGKIGRQLLKSYRTTHTHTSV